MKTIPKLKTEKPTGVSLNDLKGGAIFLYKGALYIKDIEACTGTNLLTGFYNEAIDSAIVEEVDATLTWQKKEAKATPKKKRKK